MWDGPLAERFRGQTWPETRQPLEKAITELEELSQRLQQIVTNVFAGSVGVLLSGLPVYRLAKLQESGWSSLVARGWFVITIVCHALARAGETHHVVEVSPFGGLRSDSAPVAPPAIGGSKFRAAGYRTGGLLRRNKQWRL